MHPSRRVASPLLLFITLVGGAATAQKAAGPAAAGTPAFELRLAGDQVELAGMRGLTVPEFLRLAQLVTGARYVFRDDEVAAAGEVQLLGSIRCTRSAFGDFVQTMLYIHGLCLEPQGADDRRSLVVRPCRRRKSV